MQIKFHRSIQINASPEDVFSTAVLDVTFLSKSVERYGPLPKVIEAHIVDSDRVSVGAIRCVTLESGGVLNEKIEELEIAPSLCRMKYRQLSGFPFPLSLISRTAGGEYIVQRTGNGSLFVWRSTHQLTSPLVFPIAHLLRIFFVHPMMHRFLKNTEAAFGGVASSFKGADSDV